MVLVVGTDTGVGKTLYATQLLRSWLADKTLDPRQVAYVKPFQTGTAPEERDSEVVVRSGFPRSSVYVLEDFLLPASPHLAAEVAGSSLDMGRALERTVALARSHARTIVEGSGGLWVPIEPRKGLFLIDFVERLARERPEISVVLVARLGLGTINHTLLSAFALEARGVRLSRVALNGFFASDDPRINEDNQNILSGTLSCSVEIFSAPQKNSMVQ